jgi:hypothetical protein
MLTQEKPKAAIPSGEKERLRRELLRLILRNEAQRKALAKVGRQP